MPAPPNAVLVGFDFYVTKKNSKKFLVVGGADI